MILFFMNSRYKGVRDFYPEEKRIQNYIFEIWRKNALRFGFEEIEPPILEPLELYIKKSGEEIEKQIYTLVDKAGRKLALRPETTPSIVRMISQRKDLTKPIKWFSISRCFRYERPQAGRLRSFFQFNLDTIGSESMLAEAEIINVVVNVLKDFKVANDCVIKINSRKIMEEAFKNIGIKNVQLLYSIIDKRYKLTKKEFENLLKKAAKDKFSKIKELLDSNLKEISKFADNTELIDLFRYLKAFGVAKFCEFDPCIVRGLAYYTSTVFEVYDKEMTFRALAGGGRYENLIASISSNAEKIPGVGFGMGDVVLELFLRSKNKIPKFKKEVDFYIASISKECLEAGVKLVNKLPGIVEIDLMQRTLAKQLEYANKINAKNAIIIGPKDLSKNKVTIKNMKTGKEKKVSIKDITKLKR